MRITIKELRQVIQGALLELGGPRGGLRKAAGSNGLGGGGGSSGRKVKLGKIEDENKELSPFEAEAKFPGATEAWAEVVPELYPDFPFDDPKTIVRQSLWFQIGDQLRVAFASMPQHELMSWDPQRQDWFEIEH